MLAAFAAALALAQPIVLSERTPIAFLLNTPTGDIANTSSSDIIRVVSASIEQHTSLFIQESDAHIAADCKGRPGFIGCLVLQVRTDYNRDALVSEEGRPVPYSEHLRRLKDRRSPYPHYLLVLSNVAVQGQADRLSAILVDTDQALDLYHSASRQNEDWRRETEARINETAVLAGPVRGEVKSRDEAKRFLERLIEHDFAPIFEHSGHWEPYGAIAIEVKNAGIGIALDGAAVGTTGPGRTEIKNVLPGARRVTLEHPEYHAFAATVEVERGKTAVLQAELVRATQTAPFVRKAVFWSGVGAAVAGAAVIGLALAKHNGDVETACFAAPGSGCKSGLQFETSGYNPAANDVNPSGILLAPLGYSLIATGATWSVGTALFGEEGDVPWIPIAAGVAVGVIAYGLSAALNGSSPTAAPAR